MNELRYQLDLMRAMNQKLSAKERMYRLLCDILLKRIRSLRWENGMISLTSRFWTEEIL